MRQPELKLPGGRYLMLGNLAAFAVTFGLAAGMGHLLGVSLDRVLVLYGLGVLPCYVMVRAGWL